jgi:hypothetical protein
MRRPWSAALAASAIFVTVLACSEQTPPTAPDAPGTAALKTESCIACHSDAKSLQASLAGAPWVSLAAASAVPRTRGSADDG